MNNKITDTQKIDIIIPVNNSESNDEIPEVELQKIGNNFTGLMKERWFEFLLQRQSNDQIHKISSDKKLWSKKMGYHGYAIIRDNRIIKEFITLRN